MIGVEYVLRFEDGHADENETLMFIGALGINGCLGWSDD